MDHVKKSDLLTMVGQRLNTVLLSKGFAWDKGKNYFIKEFETGKYLLGYNVLNSYNFDDDNVAWDIRINYFVYFDEVHRWFLKFEHRSKKDLKYDWTYGISSEKDEYFVDIDEPKVQTCITEYVSKIVANFENFKDSHQRVGSLKEVTIVNASKISDLTKGINFRQIITDLTILKILDLELFEKNVSLYSARAEILFSNNDPMAKIYFPRWQEILSELKALKTN